MEILKFRSKKLIILFGLLIIVLILLSTKVEATNYYFVNSTISVRNKASSIISAEKCKIKNAQYMETREKGITVKGKKSIVGTKSFNWYHIDCYITGCIPTSKINKKDLKVGKKVTLTGGVNITKKDESSSTVKAELKKGEQVTITEIGGTNNSSLKSGWCKIRYSMSGYVHKKNIISETTNASAEFGFVNKEDKNLLLVVDESKKIELGVQYYLDMSSVKISSENTKIAEVSIEPVEATPGEYRKILKLKVKAKERGETKIHIKYKLDNKNKDTVINVKVIKLSGTYAANTNKGTWKVGTFTSNITGKTFTLINQNKAVQGDGPSFKGECNKAVGVIIASGYTNSSILNTATNIKKSKSFGSVEKNTNDALANAGCSLNASVKDNDYFTKNYIVNDLKNGKYVMIYLTKSVKLDGKILSTGSHWVGILGYKYENDTDYVFIADPGWLSNGWYKLTDLCDIKDSMKYVTVIAP